MSTDTLDMSILAKDWHCGRGDLHRLDADGARPITLDFTAADVEPPAVGKTLIMQARSKGEELWAIRMLPSGRLLIQPGTQPSCESLYGYPGIGFALGVSFNPTTGSLALVFRDPWGAVESFNLNAHTSWVDPADGYEILLGAPESYADLSPIGWRINCSFRYSPAEQRAEDPVLGAEEPRRGDPLVRESLYGVVNKAQALFESVRDLDNERHWEAMLALSTGRHFTGEGLAKRPLSASEVAEEAAALLKAHNAWKEGRS